MFRRVLVLSLINLNEAIAGNVIWPLLPFLVRRYALPEDVGVYVGLLAASFFLGQVLFMQAWGRAADAWGRRPILLLGLGGSLLTMVWFGLAQSYGQALLARFVCGALNGNVAIAKVFVGEITTKETQAAGFAYLSLTWGMGTIMAPAIGGYLGDPSLQYPGTALDTPLLRAYPYLLPSLVAAAYALIALLLGACFLEETEVWLALKAQREDRGAAAAADAHGSGGAATIAANSSSSSSSGGGHAEVGGSEPAGGTVAALVPAVATEGGAASCSDSEGGDSDSDATEEEEVALIVQRAPAPTRKAPLPPRHPSAPPAPPPAASPRANPLPVLTPMGVLTDGGLGPAILAYACLSAVQILFDELLPVFASTAPAQGGLGWLSAEVGSVQVVNGAVQISSTLLLVPLLLRRIGVLAAFRSFSWPVVPFLLLFPLVGMLNGLPERAVFAAMCAAIAVRTVLFAVLFAAIMIAVR